MSERKQIAAFWFTAICGVATIVLNCLTIYWNNQAMRATQRMLDSQSHARTRR